MLMIFGFVHDFEADDVFLIKLMMMTFDAEDVLMMMIISMTMIFCLW